MPAACPPDFARRLRCDVLEFAVAAGGAHLGGCLSAADIMASLYSGILRLPDNDPQHPDRDRFILSKGHCALLLYAALAWRGFIDRSDLLRSFTTGGSFTAHPERDPVHGIETTTGSLGHGLALGCGLAFAAAADTASWRVFVLLGDGECQEGSVWEAAMFAAQHRLDRLTAIVDANGLQAIQPLAEVTGRTDFPALWRACGWAVRECDGHDAAALNAALNSIPWQPGRPSVLIARTVKGKGVSFMENQPLWHTRCPTPDEYRQARAELEP